MTNRLNSHICLLRVKINKLLRFKQGSQDLMMDMSLDNIVLDLQLFFIFIG
jgi:hypothetical protein